MKTQLSLMPDAQPTKYFGGSLLIGRRKGLRPLSRKHALHLVMRSTRAKGAWSFLKHKAKIQPLLDREAAKFGVKVYRVSYNSNHLHFLIRIHARNEYRKFIRSITSLIAGVVTGTLGKSGAKGFWDLRPFSRIVTFGRDFQHVARYVLKNTLEALGLVPYTPRNHKTYIAQARRAKGCHYSFFKRAISARASWSSARVLVSWISCSDITFCSWAIRASKV